MQVPLINTLHSPLPNSVIFWDHINGGIGGIESLMINLITAISTTVPVKLVAKKESIVYQVLIDRGEKFTHILPTSDVGNRVDRNDLLVCFGGQRAYRRLLKNNPKVMLWRVYPYVMVKSFWRLFLLKKTLQRLDKLDSLLFMDRFCHWETSRQLGTHFSAPILPIPIQPARCDYRPKPLAGRISFSYIGRGAALWKIKPVKCLVAALSHLEGLQCTLHIFTDTTDIFERELADLLTPGKITVEYHIGIRGTQLREMLLALADIHYSMGTSVLEGAAIGIPSLIADASHYDFPEDYRFRWLTDDLAYYAGIFLESGMKQRPGHTLGDIVAQMHDQNFVAELSRTMHKVANEHFSLAHIATQLLEYKAKARISDVTRFMPSRWLKILGK